MFSSFSIWDFILNKNSGNFKQYAWPVLPQLQSKHQHGSHFFSHPQPDLRGT